MVRKTRFRWLAGRHPGAAELDVQARTRSLVIGIAVLVGVQALAITLYMSVTRTRTTPRATPFAAEILTARPSPPLTYSHENGPERSLGELRGKVVMVHFWATWCEPCRRELPGLLSLAAELQRDGAFELVAVSVDDQWNEIRSFFDGQIPRAVVRPVGSDVHRRFGASTLPDTYLVNANGELVVRYAGARDWTADSARRHLSEMLEKQR